MDEQRLQEIENSIGLIDCPECEMGRVSREGTFEDGQDYDRCETCDGSGMVSRFPEGHALIAEVRRLRADVLQQQAEKAEIVTRIIDQRDAARAERDALFNSARALLNDEPQANGEYIHAVTCSADRKKPIGCGGCSCQLGRRIKLLASALTEARRVLREVEWGSCEYPPVCPMCALAQHEGHSVYCALAAVLAQEEK